MATHSGKKGARETTELRQADESDPPGQPPRPGLLGLLERTTRFIGYVTVILLVVVVVSKVAVDMWKRPILIDPVILPKAMEDQGYTGLGAANRMADEIGRIEDATRTFARKDKSVQTNGPSADIEIPETKLSLASAIGLLQDFLPVALAPRHVSAELIFEAAPPGPNIEPVVIFIRMTGRRSPPRWTRVVVHSPDEAVTRAAREVLEMTNPYVLSVYASDVEHDRNTALRLIQEAITLEPRNPIIYDGWGSILDDEKDYDGAIAKYRQALAFDQKDAHAYNNWGLALDRKQDYDGAIAK
jgi:tetratricopeptide (TPR) repeat protein